MSTTPQHRPTVSRTCRPSDATQTRLFSTEYLHPKTAPDLLRSWIAGRLLPIDLGHNAGHSAYQGRWATTRRSLIIDLFGYPRSPSGMANNTRFKSLLYELRDRGWCPTQYWMTRSARTKALRSAVTAYRPERFTDGCQILVMPAHVTAALPPITFLPNVIKMGKGHYDVHPGDPKTLADLLAACPDQNQAHNETHSQIHGEAFHA